MDFSLNSTNFDNSFIYRTFDNKNIYVTYMLKCMIYILHIFS